MSRDVNRELLELAAFGPEELEEFYPQWLEATQKLQLTDEVVENAVDHYIPDHWQIQYLGIRKMIGAYLREIVELTKTTEYKKQGRKIVYGIPPAIGNYYYAAKLVGGDRIFVGMPDLTLTNALNGFFHGTAPFLNKAEQSGLNYGCRHCALNKMRYAAILGGVIAAPDIIWSWGFNCDEGPKTDEFIQRMVGKQWNFHVSRLPHDSRFDEDEDQMTDRLRFLSDELRLGVSKIEEACGIKISDEDLEKANKVYNGYRFKLGMLTNTVAMANPPILDGESMNLLSSVVGSMFASLNYMEDAIDTLLKELKAAVKKGEGIMPKDTPKIGYYDLPVALPWISKTFRDNGVLPIFSLAQTVTDDLLAPTKFPDDPWMASAESWSRMSVTKNLRGEAEATLKKIKQIKADGIVLGLYDFDRWMGAQHKMLAQMLNEKAGVPVYYIEGDVWDDREYSEEAMKTRIESLCQIIINRKAALG